MFSILASVVVTYTLFLPIVMAPVKPIETMPGAEIYYGRGEDLKPTVDSDINAILDSNAIPIVVLKMAPRWARESDIKCSRVTDLPAFGRFAHDAALRYPKVKYWEIWNEEDATTGIEDYFGCWGDPSDPYWGGRYYADVLKAVYPEIKSANPFAQVVFGGLANPLSLYLEGALFWHPPVDVFSFHYYATYPWGNEALPGLQVRIDHIKEMEKKYGYDGLPIILGETSLICNPKYADCPPPDGSDPNHDFYYRQADWLETMNQIASENQLLGWSWFYLPNGGWFDSGLLYANGDRKPAYFKFLQVR